MLENEMQISCTEHETYLEYFQLVIFLVQVQGHKILFSVCWKFWIIIMLKFY